MPPSCALLGDLQSVHGLHCYGNTMQTRNVSEYMLVLTLCLVNIVNESMILFNKVYQVVGIPRRLRLLK